MGRIAGSRVPAQRLHLAVALLLATAAQPGAGCNAHATSSMQANLAGEPSEDRDEPSTGRTRGLATASSGQATGPSAPSVLAPLAPPEGEPDLAGAPSSTTTAFWGVVHGLSMKPEAVGAPACTCLAVVHGAPADPRFAWAARAPDADSNTLAIAISGDVACNLRGGRAEAAGKPSIAAVGREQGDVVLTVGWARPGVPIERGALVQRPGPGRAIIVRSKGGAPFGRPLGARAGDCRIAL